MTTGPVIVWFRQDLRLADNPALAAAARSGRPVIPLYVLEANPASRPLGGAARWWLDKSLRARSADLAARGGRLVLRRGDAARIVETLAAETGASGVYWNRLYDPATIERDGDLKAALKSVSVEAASGSAALLNEPWTVKTGTGGDYKVFTPYWRAALGQVGLVEPEPAPGALPPPAAHPDSDTLDDWALHPHGPDWSGGFAAWTPGEAGAWSALRRFLDGGLADYPEGRDRPAEPATSRLSPHLHWGEIGPRQIWRALADHRADGVAAEKFRSELGWREFNHHVLYHRPTLPTDAFKPAFDAFPWRTDPAALAAWSRGRTGYPIVDAGMRELWVTGWMHNRVRMIVASFLTKHLLLDWRAGEAWFWDTLVDADIAQNAANWQWVAGCGADAAPYFRIFNPVLQGEKFDADGRYVRRWAPELARLPDRFLHRPWEAPAAVLAAAGVELGRTYPRPIVDHAAARRRALEAFEQIRTGADE